MYFARTIVIYGVFLQCLRTLHAIEIFHLPKQIPLCGNRSEVQLTDDGFESARIINLRPAPEYDFCELIVRAPTTHVIHLQFAEDNERLKHKFYALMTASCDLDIYLENLSVWHGDLCTSEPLKSTELLSSKVTLQWRPARDKTQTRGRFIFVTAVGRGEFCRRPNQHTCMKIGFDPMFCVSSDLTCDGHENCPPGSKNSDESAAICESGSLWTKRFMGVMNKMPNISSTIRKSGYVENATDLPKLFNDIGRTWNNIKRLTKIETTTRPSIETRSFGSLHELLSQYDPWGYLCLGVVLCGALLLMCCGIWECCIRRYKSDATITTAQPTLLIVNGYEENGGQSPTHHQPSPPNYDELDLPPSYTTLFLNKQPDDRNRDAQADFIPMDSINAHGGASTADDDDESVTPLNRSQAQD